MCKYRQVSKNSNETIQSLRMPEGGDFGRLSFSTSSVMDANYKVF